MSPAEDAALLLRIVRRHLVVLRMGMEEEFPVEEWGFQAQQAVEKILKAWIALDDQEVPRSHELAGLSRVAGVSLPTSLLQLQVFAVEARYEEGPYRLPASRPAILAEIEALLGVVRDRLG